MNSEKGNTVIGLLAVIAVALLVGILIGVKKDEVMDSMDTTVVTKTYQKVRNSAQEKMDMFKAKTGEEEKTGETQGE